MAEDADPALAEGTMVGGYRIEYRLGGGGFGTVYAAEEPTIKKRVAIKVLRGGFAHDSTMAARFEREARAANDVRHPGIVDVFAFGKLPDGRPYLVMSLLQGRSLRDEIAARGRIPAAEAWTLAREIGDALAAAHDVGVVHRDLKPDNVFLETYGTRAPRPRILDFGIAKLVAPDEETGEPAKLTQTGVPIGTPAYMAPEQWWAMPIDARTDQYAFGVMLFEMLAGRPPFTSQQFLELGQHHTDKPPPTFASLDVDIPPPLEALVRRALEKKPGDRFASMAALLEAGDATLGDLEATGGKAPPPAGGAKPAVVSAKSGPEEAFSPTHLAPLTPAEVASLAAPADAAPARWGRYLSLHVAALVLALGGLYGVGYAGEARRDLPELFKQAGFPSWAILFGLIAGAIALPLLARRRARTGAPSRGAPWLTLLPAICGLLGTYPNWMMVLEVIERFPPTERFRIFNAGAFEANTSRFTGLGASVALCVSLAAMPGVHALAAAKSASATAPLAIARRESIAILAGLVGLAAVALALGAPSAAYVAGIATAVLACDLLLPCGEDEAGRRRQVERSVWASLAVVLAAVVALSRVEARECVLWVEQPTRAHRVAELIAAAAERRAATALSLVAVLVAVVVGVLRVRRLWRHESARLTVRDWALLACLIAGLGADAALHESFVGRRDRLREELSAQFTLFARLDPPSGDELERAGAGKPPSKAPTLQIAREAVAVNSVGVAPIAALDGPEAVADVKRALNAARAAAVGEKRDPEAPDLALYVDREVPWATVAKLLAAVRPSGVRTVDVLLTRGDSFELPRSAPPEAAYILPKDFVALPVLLADDGAEPAPDDTFGKVAPELVRRHIEHKTARVELRVK